MQLKNFFCDYTKPNEWMIQNSRPTCFKWFNLGIFGQLKRGANFGR